MVLKQLKEGSMYHQFKEPFNQNALLSFIIIKRKTTKLESIKFQWKEADQDDPWAVEDDDDKAWGLVNERANIDHDKLSELFDIYKQNI